VTDMDVAAPRVRFAYPGYGLPQCPVARIRPEAASGRCVTDTNVAAPRVRFAYPGYGYCSAP
jgi:hypothetical protein